MKSLRKVDLEIISPVVILSEAKDLCTRMQLECRQQVQRSFASLRMTRRGAFLDLAVFSAGADVDQSKSRSLAGIAWFDGYDVLVVFRADFEFGDRAGIFVA